MPSATTETRPAAVEGAADPIELRREASEALRSSAVQVAAVSWLYRLGAAAYGVATLFAVLALADLEVPLEGGLLVVALTTLLTVLLEMGAAHIQFRPFVWNVVIAALATAVAVVHAVGPNPLGIALPASAGLALLLWVAILPTRRARTLIQRHKDLYILHHASAATRRSLRAKTAEEKHERLVAAMRRASGRAWITSAAAAAAIVLVVLLGAYAVVGKARPDVLDDALAAFRSSWNTSDVEAVGAQYDARIRASETDWLAGRTAGLGWAGGLPELGEAERRSEGGREFVTFATAEAPVVTSWIRVGTRWTLAKVELPIPPFEPILDAFSTAWNASDADAIAEYFPAEERWQMLQTVRGAAERQSWTAYPAIVSLERETMEDGGEVVKLDLGEQRVETRWHLRGDGAWALHFLKFPPR
ncbi:MAG: hypothetical protein AAGB93_05465 [Planctomycetota bacterium]